jgi:hypothetical protein
MSDSWKTPSPPSKIENARFPTEGRKGVTCHLVDSTRKPASLKCKEARCFTLTSLQESPISPVQELEIQLFH